MERYEKKNKELLRFSFDGLDAIDYNYSQIYQDIFVLSVLDGKRNGTFLEIGSRDPIILSNTKLLESEFGWTGLAIDWSEEFIEKTKKERTCETFFGDATKIDYSELLPKYFKEERIDYLSLDIEPNTQTLKVLNLILETKYRFSVITFETDYYAGNENGNSETVREASRDFMKNNGYKIVFGDVSGFGDDNHPFEDWYLDSSIFSQEIINKFRNKRSSSMAAYKYIYK